MSRKIGKLTWIAAAGLASAAFADPAVIPTAPRPASASTPTFIGTHALGGDAFAQFTGVTESGSLFGSPRSTDGSGAAAQGPLDGALPEALRASPDPLLASMIVDSLPGDVNFVPIVPEPPRGPGIPRSFELPSVSMDGQDLIPKDGDKAPGAVAVAPLPAAAWAGLVGLAGIGGFGAVRRRLIARSS